MLKLLKFTHNAFMRPEAIFTVTMTMDGNYRIFTKIDSYNVELQTESERQVKPEDCKKIVDLIEDCDLGTWYKEYHPEGTFVLDGFGWQLEYEDTSEIIGTSKNKLKIEGDNAYPWCFYKLIRAILLANPKLEEIMELYAVEKKPVY